MAFKFITDEDTSFTALDAAILDEITQSGMFTTATIEKRFRLGNIGAAVTQFNISASGLNSTINDDVDFSVDDGINFYTSISVSGVESNEITDSLVVRYSSQEGDVIGVGSFLVKVNQEPV